MAVVMLNTIECADDVGDGRSYHDTFSRHHDWRRGK